MVRTSHKPIAKGLNVSPGAAVGVVAFDADTAERWAGEDRDVIMVRPETKPDDVHGMLAAEGIVFNDGEAWGKLDAKQKARVLEVILNTIHGDLLKAYKADLSDDLPADEKTTSITDSNILPLHFFSWYRSCHETQGPLI